MRLLLHWILSAIALLIVSHLVPGFHVAGLVPALIAALVIGLLNATVGLFLKIITFPLSILTLGIFLLVINGVMILVASSLVPGFHVYGSGSGLLGRGGAGAAGHADPGGREGRVGESVRLTWEASGCAAGMAAGAVWALRSLGRRRARGGLFRSLGRRGLLS